MGITATGVSLVINDMFGMIKPKVDAITKLGFTDFSAKAPPEMMAAGVTYQIPVSKVEAAKKYDPITNHYRSKGATATTTITPVHFLQPYDVSGEDLNSGFSAPRLKQIFATRAGAGIALAIQENVAESLSAIEESTAVKLKAAPSVKEYMALGGQVKWLDKATSVLALNGTLIGDLRGTLAANHLGGDDKKIAEYLGFADLCTIPGMKARACIVPFGSTGYVGRVPQYYARYIQAGAETDPDTGLSVGIVIADNQDNNGLNIDADLWFGMQFIKAAAGASTAGVINVGLQA